MLATVNKWSWSRDPSEVNCKPVAKEVQYDLCVITSAYEWIKLKPRLLAEEDGQIRSIYVAAAESDAVTQNTPKVFNEKHKTFESFKKLHLSAYKIMFNVGNWKMSSCTCPSFLKNYKCKHVYGLAVHKKLALFPETVKTVPIGQKRKPGRPKGTTKALLKM